MRPDTRLESLLERIAVAVEKTADPLEADGFKVWLRSIDMDSLKAEVLSGEYARDTIEATVQVLIAAAERQLD